MADVMGTATTSGVHPLSVIRKYLKWTIAFAVTVVILLGIKNEVGEHKQQRSEERNELLVPANGDSSRVYTKSGYLIDYKGENFELHCVYTDRRPEGINDGRGNTCKDGPMLYQYVRDTSGEPNTVIYKFVKKK